MLSNIRLALIGFGKMGQRHWQKLKSNDSFEITSIVDNHEIVENLEIFEYSIFSDYRLVNREIADAVLIACPSSLHSEVGLYFLDLGFHVFMEKPLALTSSDCRALVDRAHSMDVVLMVGMVERFNPAFVNCCGFLDNFGIEVSYFDMERFNPNSAISDSDVILDLLIHDLDILLFLVRGIDLLDIEVCDFSFGEHGYDFVDIILRFVGGITAHLKVGRGAGVGEARRVFIGRWSEGLCEVDFMRRDLVRFEHCGKTYAGNLGSDALEGEHDKFADLINNNERLDNNLGTMELLFRICQELDLRREQFA